jgi:hypothetical protein
LQDVKVHGDDLHAGRRPGNVIRGCIPASSETGMLEQFPPQPDDTVQIAAVPTRRSIALLVSAAVVAIGVLVGVGFLAFGGLGGPGNGGGGPTTGLPAISPDASAPPSTAPSATPPASPTEPPTTTAPPMPVTATPTLTPTTPPAVAVSIANASMKPPAYQGANCPGSTTAVATVIASGPLTMTYRWTSTALGSPPGGTVSFTFAAAGSHQFSHPFTNITTPNGQVTASFVMVTPVARRASMSYTQKCGAKVTKVTSVPEPLRCQVQFRATLYAGVGPMTVRYHWVYNGAPATGTGATGTWQVTKGGGQTTTPASPKASDTKPVTAVLVIESPVHDQSAQASASCT